MNLRKFWLMFLSTALVGLVLGFLTTLTGQFHISLVFGIIAGGFLSATTLMGFWAYLTLNFTMRTFISFRLWVIIQALLIGLVYYDMVYFRWMFTTNGTDSVWPYVVYALWPLVVALIAAFVKGRVSGMRSFIPAVFFLYVFTVLEWIIALKSGATTQMTLVGIILLGCNVYLLFIYTRLLKQPSPKK